MLAGRDSTKAYRESASFDAYCEDCDRYGTKPMTTKEELEVFTRVEQGDEQAREEVFMRNQRYIIKEAFGFVGGKMPVEDLIQEANLGLLKAIDRFNIGHGFRFLTYARWYVRQAMQDAVLQTAFGVTMPKRRFVEAQHAMRASAELMEERRHVDLGLRPSLDEVAERTGESVSNARIGEIMRYGCASVFSPVGGQNDGGDDMLLIDTELFAVDDDVDGILRNIDQRRAAVLVGEALDVLPESQRDLLECVFGLNGREEITRTEYAKRRGVTRQAIDFRIKAAINNAAGAIKNSAVKEVLEIV